MKQEKTSSSLYSVFLVLIFVFFAVGFYTFYNAKGLSYFSNDSAACNNCHIMNEVYNDYLKAPHSKKIAGEPKASCNDCHLPHSFVSKWIAKAESGVGHAYAFTFKLDELPTNLSANEKSKKMVQDNCVRCHSEYVSNVINPTTDPHRDNSLKCVSCHEGVGHKRGF
ncbi:cytochrome c nitrite reductase small subunit [Campylobacter sp. MIT 99-7217]|uniref:cytochrome c nitrite reductase small subunit n=1 Tax=Campylobacter sp. MIT 99-7217 TaxID=535091 RepID=UPI001157E487|nr:cytochrome c nitrite reductase small subunit [Campylobacter sp. MIT 99-7217]TQR31865.1 cytochrome c nitrite reductase small subunit [Campylobacter sp. MIT 99-7217]